MKGFIIPETDLFQVTSLEGFLLLFEFGEILALQPRMERGNEKDVLRERQELREHFTDEVARLLSCDCHGVVIQATRQPTRQRYFMTLPHDGHTRRVIRVLGYLTTLQYSYIRRSVEK
jgi:hypothetical protein